MKTAMHYPKKALLIIGLTLIALNLNAQVPDEPDSRPIQLDTVSIVANQYSFENMVSDIILNETFEYRQALKNSKLTKRYYVFSDKKFSEAEILKQFRKAARRSNSVDDFMGYFYKKELAFLEQLQGKDIYSLYLTFRKGTWNEYMQELETAFGAI